VLISHF